MSNRTSPLWIGVLNQTNVFPFVIGGGISIYNDADVYAFTITNDTRVTVYSQFANDPNPYYTGKINIGWRVGNDMNGNRQLEDNEVIFTGLVPETATRQQLYQQTFSPGYYFFEYYISSIRSSGPFLASYTSEPIPLESSPLPTLAIETPNSIQAEGNIGTTSFAFTVTRSGNNAFRSTVKWVVAGTGTSPDYPPADASDFGGIFPSGTLIFAPNESVKTIVVTVKTDTSFEKPELFSVTLSSPTNISNITTATAIGVIGNDDYVGSSGSDNLTGSLGADAMSGLAGNDTYVFNNAGDLVIESPNAGVDIVSASVSCVLAANAEALFLSGSADISGTGNDLNNILGGNTGNNSLSGNGGTDSINGGAGCDLLTGGLGNDYFVFQFGQSLLLRPDRITDYAIGVDKIRLTGGAVTTPSTFTRAANSSASTIGSLVNGVSIDANGALAGNQALGVNSAALVSATGLGIQGTYLIVNDGVAGFQPNNDLVVNITGFSGALPSLGSIVLSTFFS